MRSLQDIDWPSLIRDREFYPSPTAWQDELLYFLFVDRFSDGSEYGGFGDLNGATASGPAGERTTSLFIEKEHAWQADRQSWFEAGKSWCGGTLAGVQDKLGYLQRLGVTALWLSPVFKQVTDSNDYHGYGVQNFLEVDPHFGTRDELKSLVAKAHEAGIRVILDIILNHSGDVFAYQGNYRYYYHEGQQWPVAGFRTNSQDNGTLPFAPLAKDLYPQAWPDGAVWPLEFQSKDAWTRQGEIRSWDSFPEYLDGDFLSLKDIYHGSGPDDPAMAWDVLESIRRFKTAPALTHLAEVYKFWIAFADLDGFRIDTVKHMEPGAVRYFSNVIHEFAQSLGKENFYLIGEVTGGRQHAVNMVNTTGLDAALGINDIPDKLEFLAKGWRSPGNPDTEQQEGYFDLFRNSLLDNKHTHQWYSGHVVTLFDDHDQVGVKHKFRFCGQQQNSSRYLPVALAINLLTAGIPCLYYGTEQTFNGADQRSEDAGHSDVFLRECMFGGPFGSFQSRDHHFFNEEHSIYRLIHDLSRLRKQDISLRRGRQYLRQVSATGAENDFHFPQPMGGELRWIIAWSRIFNGREYLCAVNTDATQPLTAWVTVDHCIHPPGSQMSCLLSTDPSGQGMTVDVEERNGSAVYLTVPPTGVVVLR
ncbi:MAG: alpha-amylase [Proteobacteria bacterium]|nr:alpha-amylase [Pseudomonadota bacterium]MBU1420640.1 alpha-amylase [Pseudomonadota bacterium]MBU1453172.1 alpha-amylase [Pseudomonadota bacterium]